MESSSPPWRVFDAPPAQPAAAGATAGERASSPGLTAQPLALAAVGVAVLVGVLAVVIALGGGGMHGIAGPGGGTNQPHSSSEAAFAGELVVDVAGAVVTPGVYRLDAGARVGDAIDAAGGFGPRVDADRVAAELNLAAALTDGQQIRVPSRDEPADGSAGGSNHGGGGRNADGLIDLNSASQSELESLPGIGPVTAGKIIAARAESPFASVDDLRERGLVGEKTFESIRALITVG